MSRITEAARGAVCQVRIPGVCNYDPTTVTFAHYRGEGSGAGTALKPCDYIGADACSSCHDALDGRARSEFTRQDLDEFHRIGIVRTLAKNHRAGVLPEV